MIVTLTANPALDRAVILDGPLEIGGVQRAGRTRDDAAGKGVNVARVLHAAASPVLAVVPVSADDPYHALLGDSELPFLAVPVRGRARTNLTVVDPAGVTTKINLPGDALDEAETTALVEALVDAAGGATWVVLAGSVPPGPGHGFYRDTVLAIRERWGAKAPRVAVDAAGAPLHAVIEAGVADLIKPNHEELADLLGEDASTDDDLVGAAVERARRLVPSRVPAALVTLGSAGALLVTEDAVLRAFAPRVRVASTVGAGDSSLGGYLLADTEGADAAGRLARSVAYGAAAASLPGTQAPTPADLLPEPIAVETLSLS